MALVPDQKFSTFVNGGNLDVNDIIVGLRDGLNTRFTYTGELPPSVVIPISSGGTGATTAATARTNLGLGTMSVQNANAVAITGGTATLTSAALTTGTISGAPSVGTDITNKTYVDAQVGGSGVVNSGTINQLAWYAATGTAVSGLATANSSVLVTSGAGVPSLSTTLPAGLTIPGYQATITPAALTRVDDTNVTLTLGGTPATALLQAASLTLGWTGTLSGARGGTGVNNGASTLTLAGSLATIGAFASNFTMTGATNVTFPTSGTLATTSQIPSVTPAALTKVDDTNVTLTLGGTPATALLQASSLTLGWTGTLSGTRGGTGVNNGASTFTMGGSHILSGAFASTFTFTNTTSVTFPTSGTLATTSQIPTGAALTKTDDTNITLTLGGSPTTALVNAASLTLGWTGTLSGTRGGTGVNNGASTFTMGGNHILSGAFASTFTFTNTTSVTFPTSGTLATTSQLATPAALTKVDDTNVTLTLGGTPATALLQAASLTLGWTGTLAETRGGTAQSTYTLGDILYSSAANTLSKLAGNITTAKQYLSQTGNGSVSAAPAWATITGADITGAALTKVDDTNVTLTLGGTPTTSLLRAASLTLGWTGQLSVPRGGTGLASATAYAVLCGGTTSTGAFQSVAALGSSGQVLTSNGAGALPTFQPVTGSGTVNSGLINQVAWYAAAGTAVSGLTTVNNGVLVTSAGGVPSISTTLPSGLTIPGYSTSMILITSGTASNSASISLTGLTGYSQYIVFYNNAVPATNGANLNMLVSTNNGGAYDSSAIYSYIVINAIAGVIATATTSSTTAYSVMANLANTASLGGAGQLILNNPAGSNNLYILNNAIFINSSSSLINATTCGRYAGAATVNAIQFVMSTGNISTGSFYVYGVK